MDVELWSRAAEVFERVFDLDEQERVQALDEACGDDAELRRVVERMLDSDTETRDLLQRGRSDWGRLFDEEGAAPATLGPYRVLGEIGRGGMGAVYLGERFDGRFDRKVALKVVQGAFASQTVRERFQSEARILAGLEHPNIARLYDAGAEDGRPYLVMEYVEGERIDRYCDARRLGIQQRLELFRQVCAAVQFAHQNLVIHRDLKPSNILVTSEGSVRLLDFGIAKLVSGEAGADATITRAAALTPEYASPEQLQGKELTTGSDVYSLGVVLYELLTGRRPFQSAPGDLTALSDRVTRSPSSPSAVVTRPHERRSPDGTVETVHPDTLGQARGSTPQHLRRLLAGDLDRIVLKALRPQPGDRYASGEALAEDVRRHLAGLPITARPDSLAYRATTFVRRHRVGVAVAGSVAAALIAAAGVATHEAQVARRQRDTANRAFAFLEDLITSPDPVRGSGVAADSVRMIDFIDEAAAKIDTELTDEPEARARMLSLLGRVYLNLGRGEQAISTLETAVDAGRNAFGPSVELAEAMGRLGFALDQHGDRERGETLIRQALDMATEVTDERSETTANWQEFLGRSLLDSRQLDDAEPYLRAAYETRLELVGPDDPMVARSLNTLGSLYSLRGDQARATETTEEVLEIFERAGLGGSPDYAITEANLALMYDRSGRLEDADRTATDAVAKLGATVGPSHFLTAATEARLAGVRGRLGHTDEADSIYRAAIGTLEQVAANNVALPVALGNYATLLRNAGRPDEAETMGRRDLAAASRIVGEDHPLYAGALMRVANALLDQGRGGEAEALHGRARDTFAQALGPEHPQTHEASVALARSWMATGKSEEAERLLRATLDQAASARGADDPMATRARQALIELYESQGRSAEAQRLRGASEGG